jgi:hypothetical protein
MGMMPAFFNTSNMKKRKKQKFKSAEEKRKHMHLEQSWNELKRKHYVEPTKKSSVSNTLSGYKLTVPPGRESINYPSVDTGLGNATKPIEGKRYTGDKVIGIGTLHKSNAVPIFSDQEAKDISKMRRG